MARLTQASASALKSVGKDGIQLLRVLGTRGPMKKAELTAAAGLSRWRGDKALLQLETLMWVTWDEDGPAKLYSLTDEGREIYTNLL